MKRAAAIAWLVRLAVAGSALFLMSPIARGQSASPILERHEGDDYTRYELLAPESAQFKIIYDVTATRPGATKFFNVIRKGSEATDEAVFDRMTGKPLPFAVVSGAEARANGQANADLEAQYIQVTLARPVPAKGETRLRIVKTYKDPKSYYKDGSTIVFDRGLGIKRNAVVLPKGYELIGCNVPSQILTDADGRIAISFLNTYPGEAPLVIKARALAGGAQAGGAQATAAAATGGAPVAGPASGRAAESASSKAAGASGGPISTTNPSATIPVPPMTERLNERAFQDREIVYFLQQPTTHAFALYHDYTESRPGISAYVNVVRAGSKASNPAARLLDTGEELKLETLKGAQVLAEKLDTGGDAIQPDSDAVVVRFPAVQQGQSVRLRISETYTDAGRYYMLGDEFVWDRVLGRPRNGVVLPADWYLTASSIPAVVSMTSDGRIRLDYDNPRPDELAVLLKGKRR